MRKWLILIVTIAAGSMVSLDQTIMPVAIPTIQREMACSESLLQWMIDIYFLTLATLILAGGKLADLFGKRKMLVLGVFFFGLGSFMCGISQGPLFLIFSRFLQGLGGALLLPPTLPLVYEAFPERLRGRVTGIHSATTSLFLVLGPLVGGFCTEYLTWRYAFFINVPITIIALLLIFISIPKSTKQKESFDLPGFLASSSGIILLTIGLMEAKNIGWTSFLTITLILSGIMFLCLLYFTDKKAKHPFISFELFKNNNFKEAALNIFLSVFSLIITVFWAIYFQKILHISPMEAGYYVMITSIPILFTAPLTGMLYDRFGPKLPMLLGLITITFFMLLSALVLPLKNVNIIILPLFGLSVGITVALVSSFAAGIHSAPIEKRGSASGILGCIRSTSANFGVAVLGSFITTTQSHFFIKDLSKSGIDGTTATSYFKRFLSSETIEQFTSQFEHSYLLSFICANLLCTLLSFLGILTLFFVYKKQRGKTGHMELPPEL